MGCACSSSARQQSAAAAAHDGSAAQPRASSQGSSSVLVNAFLGAMTPALQHGIGSSIVNWDEAGAVLMHSDEWSLHVRRCGDAEGGGGGGGGTLLANEVVRGLRLECLSCELRPDALINDPWGGEPSWQGIESQLVCFDVELKLLLDLDDRVEFELRSAQWPSWTDPAKWVPHGLDPYGLALKHGTLSVAARCCINPAASLMRLAVLRSAAEWDVEISLKDGVPLPDWLEDGWLARALERRLAMYTCESPLEVDMLGRQRGVPARGGAAPAGAATSSATGTSTTHDGPRGEAQPLVPVPAQPPSQASPEPDLLRYIMEAGLPTTQPATAAALSIQACARSPQRSPRGASRNEEPPATQQAWYQKRKPAPSPPASPAPSAEPPEMLNVTSDLKLKQLMKQIKQKLEVPDEEDAAITAEVLAGMVPTSKAQSNRR
jgi:hypothetical protein